MSGTTKSVFLILFSVLLAVFGQVLLKLGVSRVGSLNFSSFSSTRASLLAIFSSPVVLSGLVLFSVSSVFWIVALSRVDLSFAYPIIGISYVLILVLSKVLLHEDVSLLRWVGAAIICIGVALVSRT